MPVLRILSGACKGMGLLLPPKHISRPTKALVRTSLFNVLRPSIASSAFVEVFGGSGSVGLEALSCGAQEALFFEQDKEVFALLKENIRAFRQRYKQPLKARAILGDGLALLPQAVAHLHAPQIIFYLDPPFGMDLQLCWDALQDLPLPSGALLIFEHHSQADMPIKRASLSIIKRAKFGRTSLSYYTDLERI
ncbi:16S rRNA (guanine(966)-N(2))-methyltransferase RsmD [Helicobacter vulpis]|uniref:16S rRNA (guanine(966)-N(2))-methyltransferase RsmD n=1 Tax=Helicobacter vulpis TaxID=2316076 RepID=UPI000EB203FD|nr:16S rRNA (guanine(966)-N(2))-methyltransferase RsmD [Helicobacter vulpis]